MRRNAGTLSDWQLRHAAGEAAIPDRADVTLGFLPLLDSAILIAAAVKGFAGDEQISLTLVRETAWETVRDRMSVGHFHAAHMPAPMAIAGNLGLSPLAVTLVAPMSLGLGGSAITVSPVLHEAMENAGLTPDLDPLAAGSALRSVVGARLSKGASRLRFATGHAMSGHSHELRYWLAASGIDPDREVELVSLPPALTVDALATGLIDGCCLGEPWNTVAVSRNVGRIVTVKARIWRNSPEKVLAVSRKWAEANGPVLEALLRALYRAGEWCANPANLEELAGILAARQFLGVAGEMLLPALTGMLATKPGHEVAVADFLVLHQKAASFPWQSHALWFYSQMVRWGQCPHTAENSAIARDTYRPDLYRQALKPLFAPVPGANLKLEGTLTTPEYVGVSSGGLKLGPDGFFDGAVFDPDDLEAYIADQRRA